MRVIPIALLAISATASAAPLSPFLKGPYLQELSKSSVVIRIETDPPSPISVRVGARELKDELAAMHSVRVDGLEPKTAYRYVVTSGSAKSEGSFTTAPPDDDTAPVTFLIYGDNRSDAVQHGVVVRAMQSEASDFLVHTGDFVAEGGRATDWQAFFDVEQTLLRDRCAFATVGNHELTEAQGTSFLRYFGSEQAKTDHRLDDTMRWGMVRFFFLNAWGSLTHGTDRDWLERVLTDSDGEKGVVWRFLVAHHGPYSSSLHGPNDRFAAGELEPLLLKHKIDLVISGHDHVYERGANGMLRYIVSGGGGAPLYAVGTPLPQTRHAEAAYHYIRVTVTSDKVSLVAKRPDDTSIESSSFTLKSDHAWDGEPDPVAKPAAQPQAAAKAEDRCNCTSAGAPSPAPPAFFLLGLLALRRRSALR